MVVRKQKKSRKQRGSARHGWGARKKHRGAGNRGGRGKAGTGKRGAQRKTYWLAKGINPLGKKGMIKKRSRKFAKTINISDINKKLNTWIVNGKVGKDAGVIVIDLAMLGYNKLLGTGVPIGKFKINVKSFSKKAKEKIEKAGGEIVSKSKTVNIKVKEGEVNESKENE